MKRIIMCMALLAFLTFLAAGQNSESIVGNWKGDREGVTWVTLNVDRASNGELAGTAVFSIMAPPEDHRPPRVVGSRELKLLDPAQDGNVFLFKIKNHQGKVTMDPSSGDTIQFQMTLTSDTEATLRTKFHDNTPMPMVKQP